MSVLNLYLFFPYFFITNAAIIMLSVVLYLRNRFVALSSTTLSAYTIFTLLITLILFYNLPRSFSAMGGFLVYLPGSFVFTVITLLIAALALLVISTRDKVAALISINLELYFLRLIVVIGLLFLIVSGNLVLIFFALELYSLSAYILVAQRGKISVFSSESGIKYFILGTVFSLLFIYGSSLVYGALGTSDILALEALLEVSSISSNVKNFQLYIGILLILISLLFKIAAAPFHFWAPGVYEAASTSAMLFLSLVPKAALLFLFIKLSTICSLLELSNVVCVAAVLSVLIGSFAGVYQKRIKPLLIYSSINSTGFLLIPLISSDIKGSIPILVFYLVIYLITSLGLFSVIYCLRTVVEYTTVKHLYVLSNLFFIRKALSVALTFLLFSSAGLPPFIGFFTKFFILFSASSSTATLAIFFMLLAASLSVFYYIRVTKVMAFSKKKNYTIFLINADIVNAYVISFSLLSTILFTLCSDTFLGLITLFF